VSVFTREKIANFGQLPQLAPYLGLIALVELNIQTLAPANKVPLELNVQGLGLPTQVGKLGLSTFVNKQSQVHFAESTMSILLLI